jgi:hypothetical protein
MWRINFAKMFVLFLVISATLMATSTSEAGVWSIKDDFASANPNGAWTYGVYLEDGHAAGNFYAWPALANWGGTVDFYGNPGSVAAGVIFHNNTPESVDGTTWLKSGDVCLYAATLGWLYDPVVRWTAPEDMTVSVDALFTGQCEGTSDVHILLNGDMVNGTEWGDPTFTGTHLLDAEINGNYGYPEYEIPQTGTVSSAPYTGVITVHAGDTIDFVSGYGSDHTNTDGAMIGVSATITTVPEPSSIGLLGLALIGFAGMVWRKRK